MRKYFYGIVLIGFLVVVILLYFNYSRTYNVDITKSVYLQNTPTGKQLIRHGSPFYIKGVSGTSYFKALAEIGGNTVRVYDTTNIARVLDEAQHYNLAVIVDIPLPIYGKSYNPYKEESYCVQVQKDVKRFVNTHKNHPALLIWNLGNELNYPLVTKKNNFINTFNALIDVIHLEDPNHLVGTTISGTSRGQTLGIYLHSPNIDVLGFNVFSNLKDLNALNLKISLVTEPIPYYVSEWGINGPWESTENEWKAILELNSTQKGAVYKQRYEDYIQNDDLSLGSLAFYWGTKIEGTPTWFNIFDAAGRKSQTFYDLQALWRISDHAIPLPPQVDGMVLKGKTDQEPIILKPKDTVKAQIRVQDVQDTTLVYKWELYKEGWGNQEWIYETSLNTFQIDEIGKGYTTRFVVPKKAGPYRLFAYVYDTHNNFSTANIPFYVLDDR
ncbi:glycoside hydrolase family 2 TIM barrel-domain containing protein [uncultured Formosa sp.]|uniref:glycoside hydrolase family 2 TIM barrel-domain containing protein n=1 Tax=uncultured Formosa sp. TaxID=255435 RepID=UPI00260E035F|nr:glycoside hydrolase family 2 TIM barrel-domain containing protein [uncultured Formosa sp.]